MIPSDWLRWPRQIDWVTLAGIVAVIALLALLAVLP